MKKRFHIYLYPIEISSREFPYKFFLSTLLDDSPSIHIFSYPWILQTLLLFAWPVNWIGQNIFEFSSLHKRRIISTLRQRKSHLFFFDEEGGVYPSSQASEYFLARNSHLYLSNSDTVFSWGRKQQQLLSQKGINSFCYGHPRFQNFKCSPIPLSNPYKFNYSLIISSCSILTSSKNYSNELGQQRFLFELKNHSDKFSKILKLVSAHPDVKYVLRPHPSESVSLIRNFFRHFDNVVIDNSNFLSSQLYYADSIFHFNCTTSLDALSLGISVSNLSELKYTAVSDIDNIYESDWLHYPANVQSIISVIKARSVSTSINPYFVLILLFFLDIVYLFNRPRKSFSYQFSKSGWLPTFNPLKSLIFTRYIIQK